MNELIKGDTVKVVSCTCSDTFCEFVGTTGVITDVRVNQVFVLLSGGVSLGFRPSNLRRLEDREVSPVGTEFSATKIMSSMRVK